jgi:type III secretory pathway lipoprotein EscJ
VVLWRLEGSLSRVEGVVETRVHQSPPEST